MDLKGHSVGELLHTGLRKGLDSDWSALAWNFVHVISGGPWGEYCKWAEKRIEQWPQNPSAEDVNELFCFYPYSPQFSAEERAAMEPYLRELQTWKLILRQAGRDDLLSMRSWINECVNGGS